MFASKPPEGGGIPMMAWGVAGLAVLVVVIVLVMAGRHKAAGPPTIQPLAAYAANLPLSQLAIAWCLRNRNVSTVMLGAAAEFRLER